MVTPTTVVVQSVQFRGGGSAYGAPPGTACGRTALTAATASTIPDPQPLQDAGNGFAVETVDSLGAGDAFAATLGVRLATGRSLPGALRDAAIAGALTTTRNGVFDALPTLAAIEAVSGE